MSRAVVVVLVGVLAHSVGGFTGKLVWWHRGNEKKTRMSGLGFVLAERDGEGGG